MDEEVIYKYIKAGKIAADAREFGISLLKDGARLLDVAEAIEEFIREKGAKPAFPANLSLNHEAAHYTPLHGDDRRVRIGDLVKVDVGAHVDGYIGDTSRTVEIGTERYRKLIRASEEGLNTAIEIIKIGTNLDDVGKGVEAIIRSMGYRPIQNLTGHSLDRYNLHSGLSIPSVSGMENKTIGDEISVAIEPFATDGAGYVVSGGNLGIYRVRDTKARVRERKLRDFFDYIAEEFGHLPFAQRWCFQFDKKADKLLKALYRKGYLDSYDVLVDAKKGMVSQKEHTLLVLKDRIIITTEGDNGL